MGHNRIARVVTFLVLVGLASSAGAAAIEDVTGMVKLNDAAVSGAQTALAEGGRVEVVGDGSGATLVSGAGDRIMLDPGSVIVFSLVSEDGEVYELRSGSFRARLSPKTVILLPGDGRLQAAEGGAELSAECRGEEPGIRTAVDVNEGGVVFEIGGQFRARVGAHQSLIARYDPRAPRRVVFETGPDNEGMVVIYDRATEDLEIQVDVPPASKGTMAAVEANTRTKIENDLESSKDGKLLIVTRVKEVETARGEVAPGVFAFVDHATGAIQFKYVEIDFQVLKRAIGLTSEFQTLAVSNFTGVLPPNPGGGNPPQNGGDPQQQEE